MNSFQTIVLGIFGFFIIAGLIVIATVKTQGGEKSVAITIWGNVPSVFMTEILQNTFNDDALSVQYIEIPGNALDRELIEALASGRGPDAVIMPAELIMRYRDKVLPIPFANYTERQFRDTYVQGAEIFLEPTGIFALPFSLDPLIMYYNRGIFDSANVLTPPKSWDEFITLGGKLTRKDSVGNISRSAVALGEFRNIGNAKEILAALFLQGGNEIVGRNEKGGLAIALGGNAGSILDFYTEFANPLKPSYSWNRAQLQSRQAFLSSRLAVYFGFGSELSSIRQQNPNLNFDVAPFPNPRGSEVPVTYGKMTGIALLRTSRNPATALSVAFTLSSPTFLTEYAKASGQPPIRRDLLALRPTDAYGTVLYDSALRVRAFRDPNPSASTPVFQDMVESITSGKQTSGDALEGAIGKLGGLIR